MRAQRERLGIQKYTIGQPVHLSSLCSTNRQKRLRSIYDLAGVDEAYMILRMLVMVMQVY